VQHRLRVKPSGMGPKIRAVNEIFGEKIQVVPERSTYASLLAGLGMLLCPALGGKPKAA